MAILHLFDAFVVITTFVLEIVLKGKEEELAALLIILRFWRIVKLVEGESHIWAMMQIFDMSGRCGGWCRRAQCRGC